MRPREDSLPWYRQFWPWLLILLPASVVVAGFVTLWLALQNDDSRVRDSWLKDGMAIRQEMARDQAAVDMGLRYVVEIDNDGLSVHGRLQGRLERPPRQLRLDFIHPNDEDQDFHILMEHAGDGRYLAPLPAVVSQRWYLELVDSEPLDRVWRLRGELPMGAAGEAIVLEGATG